MEVCVDALLDRKGYSQMRRFLLRESGESGLEALASSQVRKIFYICYILYLVNYCKPIIEV